MIHELAPGKVNLVLHVGGRRADGLHELSSLFASLELADEITVEEADRDRVYCPGVEGPNLAERAIAAVREELGGALPPLRVTIEKRIPVAAGLGGGSADCAAVLRAADRLSGGSLGPDRLRALGAPLGSDVPSQVQAGHAVVTGAGEVVQPVDLPPMALVVIPASPGLLSRDVYRRFDLMDLGRAALDSEALHRLARAPLEQMAPALENDLEAAALALRPELRSTIGRLCELGALAAMVAGSGPTVFGVFVDWRAAEEAASQLPGALVSETRAV